MIITGSDVASENVGIFNLCDGESGQDTLRLVASSALDAAAAFRADLARFESTITHNGVADEFFDTPIQIISFERIEAVTDNSGSSIARRPTSR